jgi:hypothetical protein
MKLTEKVDYLLERKSKYTYMIFQNGGGDMTIEVQLTEDFNNATLKNFALVTTDKENYGRLITIDYLNRLFLLLRKRVSNDGTYGIIECNYLPKWDS